MASYLWPDTWRPLTFSAWVSPNQRVFTGPYSPVTQVVDLIGDVWNFSMQLPDGTDQEEGAAMDALLARVKGAENTLEVPMFHRDGLIDTIGAGVSIPLKNTLGETIPLKNTLGETIPLIAGTPVLGAIAQGARTATLLTQPGRTIKAGRFLGFITGQVVMQTVDATADANGVITLEFTPRARAALAAYTVVNYGPVTVKYRLRNGVVPIVFRKGVYEGPAIEGIEVP